MKAIVTGSAGFVGRHMVAALRARGYQVVRFDIADGPTGDCHYWFGLPVAGADLLVHCAASQPHRVAIDGDGMNMVRNLHLDAAAFDWAVKTGTRMLYLSSCAAYPAELQTGDFPHWLAEDDQAVYGVGAPPDSYGWVKLTGEKMATAAQAHIPVHVVRPFSGYGEDQDDRFPFGAFAARARAKADPFDVWGDGMQVRDWIHIDDVVAGALAVVEADYRLPVNLCTGDGTAIGDLAEMMCRRAGYDPVVQFHPGRSAGVPWRVGSPTLMNNFYTAKVTLAEGVDRALTRPVGG